MKIGILIGRFQVFEPHEGHRYLFSRILENCDKLIILVGSSNKARSPRNPFTYKEREAALLKVFVEKHQHNKVLIAPLNDYLYNDSQWMADVAATITKMVSLANPLQLPNQEVTLFGHFKQGNDYLKWFPQMKYQNIDSDIEVSGTELRREHIHTLPQSVQDDMHYIDKETQKFSLYPYLGSLNVSCGDSVLECLGHVLLVKRGHAPGAGNWALPGGHKNSNETYQHCAIRELMEETNVRVPEKVLLGSIRSTRIFDHPMRSSGLPKITMAVHMVIQPSNDGSLPRANGSDDAVDARWVPIQEALNSYALHDDHGDIISAMTGVMPLIAYENKAIR